jgi:hypothetical protein
MLQKEFEENWQLLSNLIRQFPQPKNEHIAALVRRYIEQNISILNDVVTTSIENLNRLEHSQSGNDIICIQARFTHDINKKVSLSAQRFLNASLGHIADYNDWLKAHCDLTTD